MRPKAAAARIVPLLCLSLSGCSGLFHSTAAPEQTYFLRALSGTGAAATAAPDGSKVTPTAAGVSVRVGRPSAAPGLATPRIMLVQADHRMNFYAASRWPVAAPDLLEALAVQTLRSSGAWASVEDSASPFPSDYLLHFVVRRFEADYTEGGPAPVVHVVLDCTLGRREGRVVIAAFVASGTAPAAANRLGDVVAAFEQATGAALSALSQQATQVARGDAPRAAQNAASPAPSSSR